MTDSSVVSFRNGIVVLGYITAIQIEVEGAKLDNQIRLAEGHTTVNYPPSYFDEKAKQIVGWVDTLLKTH